MIKLILVIIVVLQTAHAQEFLTYASFNAQQNNFDQTFKCYLQQKVIKGSLIMELVIWDLFYYWENTNNMTTPQQALEMYGQPVHVIISTETGIDHSQFGELTIKALRGQPIKAVWIIVSNGCIQSCEELKGFLRDIRNAVGPEITIGIYTGPQYWSGTFDQKGCPQVPQEHPLFYVSNLFDRFYPFGGWKTAEYIINSNAAVPGCKVVGDRNSVYYYTKPKQ